MAQHPGSHAGLRLARHAWRVGGGAAHDAAAGVLALALVAGDARNVLRGWPALASIDGGLVVFHGEGVARLAGVTAAAAGVATGIGGAGHWMFTP
jgi:hypothetical protein